MDGLPHDCGFVAEETYAKFGYVVIIPQPGEPKAIGMYHPQCLARGLGKKDLLHPPCYVGKTGLSFTIVIVTVMKTL